MEMYPQLTFNGRKHISGPDNKSQEKVSLSKEEKGRLIMENLDMLTDKVYMTIDAGSRPQNMSFEELLSETRLAIELTFNSLSGCSKDDLLSYQMAHRDFLGYITNQTGITAGTRDEMLIFLKEHDMGTPECLDREKVSELLSNLIEKYLDQEPDSTPLLFKKNLVSLMQHLNVGTETSLTQANSIWDQSVSSMIKKISMRSDSSSINIRFIITTLEDSRTIDLPW